MEVKIQSVIMFLRRIAVRLFLGFLRAEQVYKITANRTDKNLRFRDLKFLMQYPKNIRKYSAAYNKSKATIRSEFTARSSSSRRRRPQNRQLNCQQPLGPQDWGRAEDEAFEQSFLHGPRRQRGQVLCGPKDT